MEKHQTYLFLQSLKWSCSGCHCWLSLWWCTGILEWERWRCTDWPPRKGFSETWQWHPLPVWGPQWSYPIHQLVDSIGCSDWFHQSDGRPAAAQDEGLDCQRNRNIYFWLTNLSQASPFFDSNLNNKNVNLTDPVVHSSVLCYPECRCEPSPQPHRGVLALDQGQGRRTWAGCSVYWWSGSPEPRSHSSTGHGNSPSGLLGATSWPSAPCHHSEGAWREKTLAGGLTEKGAVSQGVSRKHKSILWPPEHLHVFPFVLLSELSLPAMVLTQSS